MSTVRYGVAIAVVAVLSGILPSGVSDAARPAGRASAGDATPGVVGVGPGDEPGDLTNAPAAPDEYPDRHPDEYVVMLRPARDTGVPRQAAAGSNLSSRIRTLLTRLEQPGGRDGSAAAPSATPSDDRLIVELPIIDGFGARLSPEEAAALGTFDEVLSVEPNRRFKATEFAEVSASAGPIELPWGLDRIDQKNLPLNGSYAPPGDGSGVTAYVLDDGVWAKHQELKGRVNEPMIDFVGGFDDVGGVASECMGHGTHVAGTIAGTNVGVATRARVQAVRVLDCEGYGFDLDILRGMDWVAANAKFPAVVNMSLGGYRDQAIGLAVRYLTAKGITVVVSAGNDTRDACSASPAYAPSAITVGASTQNDWPTGFSNFGPCVDLFAPGADVLSASTSGPDQYEMRSGTSMASPHVAGTAALYLAAHPRATPDAVERAITTGAAKDVLHNIKPTTPNRLLQVVDLPDPVNKPSTDPVAHIVPPSGVGPIPPGAPIELDGSSSLDPAGGTLTYQWRVQGRDGVAGTKPTLTVIPDRVDQFEVALTVTNSAGISATDVLTLDVVDPQPPVVIIDPSQDEIWTQPGSTFTWDASKSYDPDGTPVTFEWVYNDAGVVSRIPGPKLTRTYDGGYDSATLYVTNEYGAFTDSTIRIARAYLPVAVIDPPAATVSAGETVLFDGTKSYTDPNNIDLGLWYRWHETPEGETVSSAQTYRRTFDKPGTYTVYLTVRAYSGEENTTMARVVVAEVDPPRPRVGPSALSAIEPARVLDTRLSSLEPGPKGTLSAGGVAQFTVADVPNSAAGVVLNVTAVNPDADGHLTVYPCGARPKTSNVNYRAGVTSANAVVASLGGRQQLCVWSYSPTDVVVDVTGFIPAKSAAHPVKSVRAIDTRSALGSGFGRLPAGGVVEVPVSSTAEVPADAAAVFVNVTAANPGADGHLTVYGCGEVPDTSNVNYRAAVTKANLAVVRLAKDGSLCVKSHAETDVVVDVLGWIDRGGGVQLTSMRQLDTRASTLSASPAKEGRVPAGATVKVTLDVDPAKVDGVFLNVAAANPSSDGHLTVFPCGKKPTTSALNYQSGITTSNMVFSKVDSTGSVCIATFATTDLVVDYNGSVAAQS